MNYEHHVEWAEELLNSELAKTFLVLLRKEFVSRFSDQPEPTTAVEFIQQFSNLHHEQVQKSFWLVRGALEKFKRTKPKTDALLRVEEISAALYCLAAFRLVDQQLSTGGRILQIRTTEPLIYAVITTALFGGRLVLVPDEDAKRVAPEFVYQLKLPNGTDEPVEDLERAMFVAAFENRKEVVEVAQGCGPLTGRQREDLKSHFDDLREVKRSGFTLAVHNVINPSACEELTQRYPVSTLMLSDQVAHGLLGMEPERLCAELQKLWDISDAIKQTKPKDSTHDYKPEAAPMTNPNNPQINIHAQTVALTTGAQSPAQAGDNNTQNVENRAGIDLNDLGVVLRELAQTIAELPAGKAREKLESLLSEAQNKIPSSTDAKPDEFIKILGSVKTVAEAIDAGDKIINLALKAANIAAQAFGLPAILP